MLKDNFSSIAHQYARYRPSYPSDLIDFVVSKTASRERAWDCATGNGQVAQLLSGWFKYLEATDISARQIGRAKPSVNIHYRVSMAEKTSFPSDFFDLITVAQALHWFSPDDFFKEARRLLKPNGSLAVWGYGLSRVTDEIDAIRQEFYTHVVGKYWDPERVHVETEYSGIGMPIPRVRSKEFEMKMNWTLPQYLGYLRTWSAVRHYIHSTGEDPVTGIEATLKEHWKNSLILKVRFPVFLYMGKLG